MKGDEWVGKCVYVWFEAVQGYSTCARIWAARNAPELPDGADMWKRWWNVSEEGDRSTTSLLLGEGQHPVSYRDLAGAPSRPEPRQQRDDG